MGKKNRKARGGGVNVESETGMPRSVRRECLEMIYVLLDRCSVPFGLRGDEWNDYLEVHQLVEKLRKKQQAYVLEPIHREKHFEGFMDWLRNEGVDTSAVGIENFGSEGWGLTALHDIEMAELFLCIPRKVMLTTESAETSILGGLLKEDRILQNMSNVVLSLHLLCERSSPNSFWKPYINILPATYTTPLYFNPEDVQLLKGSPMFGEVINHFRNITRQYAYFFKLFQGYTDVSKLPIKNFCYEDYRWAVSTVMTRQNQIPSNDGQQTISGMIPLWDMCNYSNGQLTTDFNLQKNCSECFALKEFKTGEQVCIYYGSRSNGELLLHNGFVYPESEVDRLGIKLGISKNDQLFSMKAEVLSRLSLLPSRTFYLHAGEDTVDSDTLAYLRIFAMDHDSLKVRLFGEDAKQLVQQLKDFSRMCPFPVEIRAWQFLHTRCQLLLRSYPTSIEHDEELLAGSLSEHQRLCIQLRLCEKRILEKTQHFALRLLEQVHSLLEKHQKQIQSDVSEQRQIRQEETVDQMLDQLEKDASHTNEDSGNKTHSGDEISEADKQKEEMLKNTTNGDVILKTNLDKEQLSKTENEKIDAQNEEFVLSQANETNTLGNSVLSKDSLTVDDKEQDKKLDEEIQNIELKEATLYEL